MFLYKGLKNNNKNVGSLSSLFFIKFQHLTLVPFFANISKSKKKFIVDSVIGVFVLTLISICLVGLGNIPKYFSFIKYIETNSIHASDTLTVYNSFQAFLLKYFTSSYIATFFVSLILYLLTLIRFYRNKVYDFDYKFAVGIFIGTYFSYHLHIQDQLFFFITLAILYKKWKELPTNYLLISLIYFLFFAKNLTYYAVDIIYLIAAVIFVCFPQLILLKNPAQNQQTKHSEQI